MSLSDGRDSALLFRYDVTAPAEMRVLLWETLPNTTLPQQISTKQNTPLFPIVRLRDGRRSTRGEICQIRGSTGEDLEGVGTAFQTPPPLSLILVWRVGWFTKQ